MRKVLLIILMGIIANLSYAQNTTVTDSSTYVAKSSAILDVQSSTKGFLVPRMTTTQREAITSPAEGLLVYDTDLSNFYFYTSGQWTVISGSEYFHANSDSVYITGDNMRLGVGTKSPVGRMVVVGSSTAPTDEPLFEVKNSAGKSIFAVYEDEVKVNFVESAKGNKGGFAVGGLAPGKTDPTEYLRITPDSVRVYINDAATKGVKGGFAVGGLAPGKTSPNKYLTVERDSTRIYVKNQTKVNKGGFAIGGLSPGKASSNNFLNLERMNYFIGDSSGISTSTGVYNSFFGYAAGKMNTSGFRNIFIGYQAGHSNTSSSNNLFLGNQAGYNNDGGNDNIFLGNGSGFFNTTGDYNMFIGYKCGMHNTTGHDNTFIGYQAGYLNEEGFYNVYLGYQSGYVSGVDGIYKNYRNVFIGAYSGYNSSGLSESVFIGYDAGRYNENGARNTFVGGNSGQNNKTGYDNSFFGHDSGTDMIKGMGNTFVGSSAGASDTSGFRNTYLGASAGQDMNAGYRNVFLGAWAGQNRTNGNYNVLLGFGAGQNSGNSSGNVFIGYYAGKSETGSNKLYISNSDVSDPLIKGDFSASTLTFNGDVTITGTLNGSKNIKFAEDVFNKDYKIETIEEHSRQMWEKHSLPALESKSTISKSGYDIFQRNENIVEELQKAYLYIDQLNTRIKKLENENSKVKTLQKQLDILKSEINKLK